MEKTKIAILENAYAQAAAIALLVTVGAIAPFAHNQLVTGTIVNATLFLSVLFFGFRKAAVVAIAPSMITFAIGLFPAAMAFFIPYIIMSNLLLMGMCASAAKLPHAFRIALAAGAKFALLFSMSHLFVIGFMGQSASSAFATAMSFPQLITALLGGLIAMGAAKLLQK